MALTLEYPERFERVWRPWPKSWPAGRSKKKPSYDAFCKADKALKFTDAELDQIVRDIEARAMNCETWQPEFRGRDGRQVGPPMFSTYFNQHLWNEPWTRKRVRFDHPSVQSSEKQEPTWKERGYPNEVAYRMACDRERDESLAAIRRMH